MAGCGADANPKPRGTIELVQAHGIALADAVDRALPSATPLTHAVHTAYDTVALPFSGDATREQWHRQLTIEEIYLRRHAALIDAARARDGRLPASQADPVQVWTFGPDLTLVALGGEVVVDYALRLARELPGRRVWVAECSNDVFGYVPSLRVLREGSYEGGSSNQCRVSDVRGAPRGGDAPRKARGTLSLVSPPRVLGIRSGLHPAPRAACALCTLHRA